MPRLAVEHHHVDLIAPNLLLTADSKPDSSTFEAKPHQLWPGIHLLLFEQPASLQRRRLQMKHLVVSARFHPNTGLDVTVTTKCDSALVETKRQSVAAWQLFDGDAAAVTINNALRNIISEAVATGAQGMLITASPYEMAKL